MKIIVKRKNTLLEAYQISKGKTNNNKNIVYIDPSSPDNKNTFKYKDIFKNHGANWDPINKRWFWYIGETEDRWRLVFERFIKPALEEVHKLEGTEKIESSESLIKSLEILIGKVNEMPTAPDNPNLPTEDTKKEIGDRLLKFKEMIVNLDSDEKFKETMKIITNFKNSQGHQYSFFNTILIYIQNPKARMVKSKINWSKVNRTVATNAMPIWIKSPASRALKPYSEAQKKELIDNFLKSVNKRSYNELSVGEKERISVILRGYLSSKQFEVTAVYDIEDTVVMQGKEDLIDKEALNKYSEIKWYEDDIIDETVRPIYNALLSFAKDKNIEVKYEADLGGSRGSSAGGVIKLLTNDGNDVGITKTLCHEILHEILHQTYLRDRDEETKKYFLGKEEGRAAIEQQAELGAWMVMAEYGFDLKTTSINYVALWGADKEKMVKVFDTLTYVINYLLGYIDNATSNKEAEISEDEEQKHRVSPLEIAKFIGVEDEYLAQVKKQRAINTLMEQFIKIVKK